MILPNLVVAGAPRCGTTSLYEYLAAHPDVCAATPKETRFLMDPDHALFRPESNHRDHGLAGYAKYFPDHRPSRHRVRLDATPDYMYQTTPRNVLAGIDGVKIVFVLRRPSHRVYSMFKYARDRRGALPPGTSFERFIEHLEHQSIGADKTILAGTIDHSRYVKHLTPWLADFDRDQIAVVLFEHLASSPAATVSKVARHAGLDTTFFASETFGVHNASATPRHAWTDKTLRQVVPRLRAVPGYRRAARPVKRLYNALQFDTDDRTPDPDRQLLRHLDQMFASDNQALTNLTGLDLSAWNDD